MCYPQPCSFTCKIFYKCRNLAFVYLHFDIPYSTCICSPFFFFTWYFVTLNHDWHGLDFVWFITLFHERVHDLFCHFNWHSTCSIIKICIQVMSSNSLHFILEFFLCNLLTFASPLTVLNVDYLAILKCILIVKFLDGQLGMSEFLLCVNCIYQSWHPRLLSKALHYI